VRLETPPVRERYCDSNGQWWYGQLTKTVRCDFTKRELDEDEAQQLSITYRNERNELLKLELDADPSWITQNILQPAAATRDGRPLKWTKWVNATDEEKAKNKNAKGHWEKVV